jgi:formylglycine-generating enzyme
MKWFHYLCLLLTAVLITACKENPSTMSYYDPFDPDNPLTAGDPFRLQAVIAGTGVTLTWDPLTINGLEGYIIYRSEMQNSGYEQISEQESDAKSYKDAQVLNDHRYWYKMAALLHSGSMSSQKYSKPVRVDITGLPDRAPEISFTVIPAFGDSSTVFVFDASGCRDIEDEVTALQMRWDWENDGIWDTDFSTQKTATHVYSSNRVWTIRCEVKDSGGLTSSKTQHLSVMKSQAMVYIPAGTFSMGSTSGGSDEEPVHTVYVDGFWMDQYEVTNAEYKIFCDATGRAYPSEIQIAHYFYDYPNYPVVNVSWTDAAAYVQWIGKRLPTEAEWEKAARGGLEGKTYPWGDDNPETHCNYYGYTGSLTGLMPKFYLGRGPLPVGSFAANGYGLYDMAGNVWEYCSDWYQIDYYSISPFKNPQGPATGTTRVLRGGSWVNYYEILNVRCANRYDFTPDYSFCYMGFRCAL